MNHRLKKEDSQQCWWFTRCCGIQISYASWSTLYRSYFSWWQQTYEKWVCDVAAHLLLASSCRSCSRYGAGGAWSSHILAWWQPPHPQKYQCLGTDTEDRTHGIISAATADNRTRTAQVKYHVKTESMTQLYMSYIRVIHVETSRGTCVLYIVK